MPLPPITRNAAAPGTRFRERLSLYARSGPDAPGHLVFLPHDWKPTGPRWPVLVEYAGNRYRGKGLFGELALAGLATDCRMGYYLAGQPDTPGNGVGFLWLSMPFIHYDPACPDDPTRHREAEEWFGAPQTRPLAERVNDTTGQRLAAAYLRAALPEACARYHGDPERVVFVGFSRGAIAGGCVGRFDDPTAALFRGFLLHSHHDSLGTAVSPHDPDLARLRRVAGKPSFLSWGTEDTGAESSRAAELLRGLGAPVQTCEIAGLPHTDEWVLDESQSFAPCREARADARRFLQQWF